MAKKLTDKQFSEYKEQVEAEVVKANKVVSDEKQEVRTQRDKLAKVETTFKKVGLAKNDKEINLDKQCLWVLSNLRRNKSAGPSLVYGGVHVEPRVNVLSSNSSQHQNTVNSAFNGSRVDSSSVIYVTKSELALPTSAKHQIPAEYVANEDRSGSYGIYDRNGEFVERLRVDQATPSGYKGPNYSHYHLDGRRKHYRPNETDPGFSANLGKRSQNFRRNS